MKKADLIGWIGNIAFIVGAICIALKNPTGFILNFFGNAFYVWQGINQRLSSLIVISTILCGINLYGFYVWVLK